MYVIPLYKRVEAHLREQIESGELVAGDLIPSEPQLAAQLGVSPGTARKAIDNLVRERLLYRHQGKGTYVSRIDFDNSLFRFFAYGDPEGGAARIHKETPSRTIEPGSDEICARLDVEPGTDLLRIERLGYDEAGPVLHERCWWIAALVAGLESEEIHIPDLLYAVVEERFGLPVVRAEETLTAEAASDEVADALGIAPGSPVVVLKRRTTTTGGKPIEYRLTRGRADRFSYRAEIR